MTFTHCLGLFSRWCSGCHCRWAWEQGSGVEEKVDVLKVPILGHPVTTMEVSEK